MNASPRNPYPAAALATCLLLVATACSAPQPEDVCDRYARHYFAHLQGGGPPAGLFSEAEHPESAEQLATECLQSYDEGFESIDRCIMSAESWSDVVDRCM